MVTGILGGGTNPNSRYSNFVEIPFGWWVCWFNVEAYHTACFIHQHDSFSVVNLTFDLICFVLWHCPNCRFAEPHNRNLVFLLVDPSCRTTTLVPRTCNVTCSMWWWERTVEDMPLDTLPWKHHSFVTSPPACQNHSEMNIVQRSILPRIVLKGFLLKVHPRSMVPVKTRLG